MKTEISEEDLIRILETDINKGFRIIVEKYSARLYWHVRRLVILHDDADDALQTTFISAWRNIASFRNESSLYTWLYTIATNEALALIKKRTKRNNVNIEDVQSIIDNSAEGDKWIDWDEAQVNFQNAILQLPDKQKIVFNLKYYEDMKYEDMSQILNTSVGALKASYHHAVKKIESYLRKS